jgi:hypothetical protein
LWIVTDREAAEDDVLEMPRHLLGEHRLEARLFLGAAGEGLFDEDPRRDPPASQAPHDGIDGGERHRAPGRQLAAGDRHEAVLVEDAVLPTERERVAVLPQQWSHPGERRQHVTTREGRSREKAARLVEQQPDVRDLREVASRIAGVGDVGCSEQHGTTPGDSE